MITSRAGGMPIDVIMSDVESAGIETQLPRAECWNSLSLTCTPLSSSWELILKLAPSLGRLPNLTLNMDASEPAFVAGVDFNALLPGLRTLHIVNIPSSIVWSPLSSRLVSLRFDIVISDRGLRKILVQCTALESLDLEFVVSSGEGQTDLGMAFPGGNWADEPLIAPPSLRTLVFRSIHARYLCHLMKWLRAPTLKDLALCTLRGTVADSQSLQNSWIEIYRSSVSANALSRLCA